jgi:plastocyanin
LRTNRGLSRWSAIAVATFVALAGYAPASRHRAFAQATSGTARIGVKVVLTGTPAPPLRLPMNADPYCAKAHQAKPAMSQTVEVGADGALKNVLVFVTDGLTGTYPPPAAAATFDQSGCTFAPHVLGVMQGQPIEIVNSDATLHNVHVLPLANAGFNIGEPIQGMKFTRVFSKAELPFAVKCDVHPWMSAYIAVFTHPFFGVSNDQGETELKNLPAGTFQIQVWQEKYGTQKQTVTVGAGETKQVAFTFKAS